MNKEEIKDYLKRVDELELKLTGEDRETYKWVLFGYNECARLLEEKEQENQQLHNKIDKIRELVENSDWRLDDVHDLIDGYNEIEEILKDGDVDE